MKALAINDLYKEYDNGFVALKGIDLEVAQGDFFALLGPNGAGKSTTIGIITSLVNKTRGKVTIFGNDIDRDFSKAKSYIGLVPQEFNFNIFEYPFQILVEQAGYYGVPRKIAKQRAEFYLNKLDLWDKRYQQARFLSGGMKRRLMIARALVHSPQLLILDEPTAGVDIEIRRSMWDFLREINAQGTTVILTTHYLEEAETMCNNIAIIDLGRIIENTSMKKLLKKLNIETFILYLAEPITFAPAIAGFPCRLIDETTLEVDVHREQAINELFQQLAPHNITVSSMRNKVNRLEELFLGMITSKNGTKPEPSQQKEEK